MSSNKKLAGVPPMELTSEELRVALAFRRIDPKLKRDFAAMIENVAADFQAKAAEARPDWKLRLVSGGAA